MSETDHKPNHDPILDRDMIAARLRISLAQTSNLLNRKTKVKTPLPCFSIGSRKFSKQSWIDKWVEDNREQ